MAKFNQLLTSYLSFANLVLAGPALDQAEVKIPYAEFKSLMTEASRPAVNRGPESALLAARFRLSVADGLPVMDATFRTAAFAEGLSLVPLVGGNVTIESQKPVDTRILIQGDLLCQAIDQQGSATVELRLLPSFNAAGSRLIVPPSPASIFETGDLGEDVSVALSLDGSEQILGSNRIISLPLSGAKLEFRMLSAQETREALSPPEPSKWTWQHQALVKPSDGVIDYHVLAQASAVGGAGVAADLTLPADAREVKVLGEDVSKYKTTRLADHSLNLQIEWKTRGLLEREIDITYVIPFRPLDKIWKLQSPAGQRDNSTRTRFIIVGSPETLYAAEKLIGPFPPKNLPTRLTAMVNGANCYQLESATTAELAVNPLPVVETAEATISEATWAAKVEPDGALLIEGSMIIEHRGMLATWFEIPEKLTLLSCQVGDHSVTPVNLGDGKIQIHLPAKNSKTRIACSFTGKTAELNPVEGTMALALPKTSLFIRSLIWKIDLPGGYQAETHGNLIRALAPEEAPSRMTLKKNLCRGERLETHIFYQRADVAR